MIEIKLNKMWILLLIWFCFSIVTSLITVVFVQAYNLEMALRSFFTTMLILNLPVWLFAFIWHLVFVWHFVEHVRANRWKTFTFFALFVNYLAGFTVLSVWRNDVIAYSILLVNSLMAAIVLNDISATIVLLGIGLIASALTSILVLLSPLLLYGAPIEQINWGIVIHTKDTFIRLILIFPVCILVGLAGSFVAEWSFRRNNAKASSI